jgi:hypothetical protein
MCERTEDECRQALAILPGAGARAASAAAEGVLAD